MKIDLKSILEKIDEKAVILFWFVPYIAICINLLKLRWLYSVEIGLFCVYLLIRLLNWKNHKRELIFWGILTIVIIGIYMIKG